MLPRHQSECNLEKPFEKAYFDNEYGARSLGEPSWKPHIRNALDVPGCQQHSIKGGNGLDWFSSIRCPELVTEPEEKLHKDAVTSTPQEEQRLPSTTAVEELKPNSARLTADKEDIKVNEIFGEYTVEQRTGRRKKVEDTRNGLLQGAGGDKSYYTPEYSKDFHLYGSTLPVANFGGSLKTVPHTFIPLVELPLEPRIPFHQKESEKEKMNEINEVKQLDAWKPAQPLTFP